MAEYQYAILGIGIALAIMINVIIKRMHTSLEKSWAKDCVAYSPAFFCEIALICLIAVTVCLLFSWYQFLYVPVIPPVLIFVVFRRVMPVKYNETCITVCSTKEARILYSQLVCVYTVRRAQARYRSSLIIEYRKDGCTVDAPEVLDIPIDFCIGVPRFIAYASSRMQPKEE